MRSELQRIAARNAQECAQHPTGLSNPMTVELQGSLAANELVCLLFQWCGAVCANYCAAVRNFTTSFADGRLLCLMVRSWALTILLTLFYISNTALVQDLAASYANSRLLCLRVAVETKSTNSPIHFSSDPDTCRALVRDQVCFYLPWYIDERRVYMRAPAASLSSPPSTGQPVTSGVTTVRLRQLTPCQGCRSTIGGLKLLPGSSPRPGVFIEVCV